MITPQKGTFGITFTPQHNNWSTDNQTYLLGEYLTEDLSLTATKHADRMLELNFSGPLGKTFTLRMPQPPCRELKFSVLIRSCSGLNSLNSVLPWSASANACDSRGEGFLSSSKTP